jgi:predicted outer membrane repeat protein
MKKHFAILTTALAAALGLLLLSACANPFISPMDRKNPAGGTGLVRIGTGAGAARTALPEAVFDYYEYLFSNGGAFNPETPIVPGGDEYALSPGNWEVRANAYMGSPGSGVLAATGSQTFVVTLGGEIAVTVALRPVLSGGTGTLSASLAYPAGASLRSFTLTLLAGTEDIDLIPAAPEGEGSFARTLTLEAGYYAAGVVLTKDGIQAGKNEVVHIYENLTTNLAFEFTDDDFTAAVVFSNADSGPGSLREALANAEAGASIVIDLDEGDRVIALNSTLAITKNLSLYGGGATLTAGSGFSGTLVSVSANVAIRNIHFKGGRAAGDGGAVNATGRLTLESCIFSDNQAGGNGGAVYASALLTVRGSTFYGNRAASGGAVYSYGSMVYTGNLFYGNTPVSSSVVSGTASSSFNVSDAGSAAGTGGRTVAGLPLSPVSFRPLGGLGAAGAEGVIAARPVDYPDLDFYGKPVPLAGAAAGAAQTATRAGAYFLDYGAAGAGTVVVSGAAFDQDGLTSGKATLTAVENPGGEFRRWMVNGVEDPEPSDTLALTVDAHATVRAVFYVVVSAAGDSVPGSLRDAAAKAGGGGIVLPSGGSLVLYNDLAIDSDLTIEGNGATINLNGRHIVVNGAATKLAISRVHFKGGGAAQYGGAIQSAGILALESCVFSDNQLANLTASTYKGGAVYSTGALTVAGSTFYGNKAGQGGAIYQQGGSALLWGNLFWGNTGGYVSQPYNTTGGTVSSQGFNISDTAIGTGADQSGFSHADDAQAASLPFSFVSFKPFAGGAAASVIPERPAGYPVLDFYGDTIPETEAAAGAVQERIVPSGSILDYAAQGPGTVELSGTVDPDGFVSGSVTLTAVGKNDAVVGTFKHWIVDDGTPRQELGNPLALSISADTTVRAVFGGTYTVAGGDNGGPGSLREALALAAGGDAIVLQGQTITLTEPLPVITIQLTIQGNGATLTQNGFVPGANTQLLSLGSGADLSVGRVHFKGGRTTGYGGAIYNDRGTLTLESCIFSDNRGNYGGAIYTAYGPLTVYASTFYGNSATGGYGGAIYVGGSPTITLGGNIFWGNTPLSSIVSPSSVTTGDTVSDGALNGSTVLASPPILPGSFKPFANGDADTKIGTLPGGYPAVDFYGVSRPSTNAATGAVQTPVTGWLLDYTAEGPGTVTPDASPNAEGLYTGSVTLAASPDPGKELLYWTLNGTKQPVPPPNQLSLSMDGHKTVAAVFAGVWTVSGGGNDGPGTLREALANAAAGDHIVLQGQTITLTAPLPPIGKSVVIEGNGATLTQSGFAESVNSQLLRIASATAEVHISRLLFKGGRAVTTGGAIRNAGILTLESCIFSDNRTSGPSARGGAIYTEGSLSVSGCTFAGNTVTAAAGQGGAIHKAAGTLRVTGNIFWANTTPSQFGVISVGDTGPGAFPVSGGYNISDKPGGTDLTETGWAFVTGDAVETGLPIHPVNFRPLSTQAAYQSISSRPAGYPLVDFYGASISASNAMAGAAQTAITSSGYALEHTVTGPGEVEVTSGTPSDGLYNGSVTFTATTDPGADLFFSHWVVNGSRLPDQATPNVLNLSMDGHKTVRGVFARIRTVSSIASNGPGSLREALANAAEGDRVVFPEGETIVLAEPLPQITTSLVIEGNGATLTQNGFTVSDVSQLLYVNSDVAHVRINRLHFKGGRTRNYGGAIRNNGTLILESCIFTGNRTSGDGGAIYVSRYNDEYISDFHNALIVFGSTFTGNVAAGSGGAICGYFDEAIALTGNIFWANTAASAGVLTSYSSPVSRGGNISDRPSGNAYVNGVRVGSGWTFAGDAQTSTLPFYPADFKPLSTGAAYEKIDSRPGDYPLVDFYGVAIPASNAMAGAVQTAVTPTGYALDYGATGPGAVTVTNGTVDEYGFYSDSVALRAEAATNGAFVRWTVDGVAQPAQTPPNELVLPMDSHKTVRGVFAGAWIVDSPDDDGPGSLREALTRASSGDIIMLQGQTVTLTNILPSITKSLIIEGNGSTLTQSGFVMDPSSQLLRIRANTTDDVRISRLHFKGGRAGSGAAITVGSVKEVTLESCVFSDNRTFRIVANSATNPGQGGALWLGSSSATVTISGCTFAGNAATEAGGIGGAIYQNGGTLNLTGNLFWGNTAETYHVVYRSSGTINSGGYNVSHRPSGAAESGWNFTGEDIRATTLPLYVGNFRPLSNGAAYQRIDSRPAEYPTVDFNGDPIPDSNAMAGAVQSVINSTGYGLDYGAEGLGTVDLTSGTVDEYGFYTGEITLTATATATDSNNVFLRWTMNGSPLPAQTPPNVLTFILSSHATVRAVFGIPPLMVLNNNDNGPGSFRQALIDAKNGDTILLPAGETITLATVLTTIGKTLVIDGNGATLTRSFNSGTSTVLLSTASNAVLSISRLHFKDGLAGSQGAAIRNTGTMILESCIFSNNSTSTIRGGAIYSTSSLTVSGCTFVGNTMTGTSNIQTFGGAIHNNGGALTLTGNIFWGNTAKTYDVVYSSPALAVTRGYNVSDKPGGATATESNRTSGWNFAQEDEADVQRTDLSFDTSFRPSSASGLPEIPESFSNIPAMYFDGTPRGNNSTPGAMPKQ